jgi:hypothetical protein
LISESEGIALILAAAGASIVLSAFGPRRAGRLWLFYLGFFAMCGAYAFTVLEGYIFPDLFNFLEHLAHAAAACLFVWGCMRLGRGASSSSGVL